MSRSCKLFPTVTRLIYYLLDLAVKATECFASSFNVGDAGNTSFVDAGTPLGAIVVVFPGSAGYLLWECCILASL